jgi:hypothetical protein
MLIIDNNLSCWVKKTTTGTARRSVGKSGPNKNRITFMHQCELYDLFITRLQSSTTSARHLDTQPETLVTESKRNGHEGRTR